MAAEFQTAMQVMQEFTMKALEQQKISMDSQLAEMIKLISIQSATKTPVDKQGTGNRKDGLTTRRAFTMLPHYSGKPEEYEHWKFQVIQFVSDDVYFPTFLDWIENATDLDDETKHKQTFLEKMEYNEKVRISAEASLSLTDAEKDRTKRDHPDLEWYNRNMYQALALNCKGEALGSIKALAGSEYGTHSGVTAWRRLTKDHRGSSATRILGLVSRVFQPQRATKLSDVPSYVELWEARIREYEKLVEAEEKKEHTVPKSCKTFLIRMIVPKEFEKDLLRVKPGADYAETKQYILEQVSLRKEAHFADGGKHGGPVPMELDNLLANILEYKEQTEGQCGHDHEEEDQERDDNHGSEPRPAEETLARLEAELFALKGGKGGKGGGKGGNGGKGEFQGNCNYCGAWGHRLNECRKHTADRQAQGGGKAGNEWGKGGGKGPKGGGGYSGPGGNWSNPKGNWGKGGWNGNSYSSGKGGGKSGNYGKGGGKGKGMYWFDAAPGNDDWHGDRKMFVMETSPFAPPGLPTRNTFSMLDSPEDDLRRGGDAHFGVCLPCAPTDPCGKDACAPTDPCGKEDAERTEDGQEGRRRGQGKGKWGSEGEG